MASEHETNKKENHYGNRAFNLMDMPAHLERRISTWHFSRATYNADHRLYSYLYGSPRFPLLDFQGNLPRHLRHILGDIKEAQC